MTDAPNTIHERMVAILAELPAIGKTQRNQQQGFMFRGHDDVLNALNPLLAKHGVYVVPNVLERITDQRTTSKGGLLFVVNLLVRYTFYGADGSLIGASAWGEGTDSGDKATNKAMTMAFKNVLNQAFAISTAETPDADRDTPEPSVPTPDPNAFHLADVLKRFELYVADAKPWIKEAVLKFYDEVTEFPGKWGDLPAKVREDLEPRLLNALAFLYGLDTPEFSDDWQQPVRGAFASAFDGTVVDGPDPFQPPAPF